LSGGGQTDRYPISIQKFNVVNNDNSHKNKFHPTQKPVELFEYLIRTYTNEGDLVFDGCTGSGTAGIACINANRNFILVEKEEEYCKIAEKRIKTGKCI
jgi:DNA modification methylase